MSTKDLDEAFFNGVWHDVSVKNRLVKVLGFRSKCIVWWKSQPQADFQSQLRYDQEKTALDEWLLSMSFHNRRHRVESTFKSSVNNKKRKALNGRTISDPWKRCISSAAFASPPLLLNSKSFLSDSDIFAASARGFLWCGSLPNAIENRTGPGSLITGLWNKMMN